MWCERRHVCLIPNSPLETCNREENVGDKISASVLRADGPTKLTPMKNLQSPDEKPASALRAVATYIILMCQYVSSNLLCNQYFLFTNINMSPFIINL